MRIASLRIHMVVPTRERAVRSSYKHLWGYTLESSCAQAFLAAVEISRDIFPSGHEAFFIVEKEIGPLGSVDELLATHWKDVPIREDLKMTGLFNCGKAARLLGWKSDS